MYKLIFMFPSCSLIVVNSAQTVHNVHSMHLSAKLVDRARSATASRCTTYETSLHSHIFDRQGLHRVACGVAPSDAAQHLNGDVDEWKDTPPPPPMLREARNNPAVRLPRSFGTLRPTRQQHSCSPSWHRRKELLGVVMRTAFVAPQHLNDLQCGVYRR
jgi:hypothetical protein